VVIYFVPLFFLFEPSLVLQGDLTPLIYVLPSVIVGIIILAGGLEGYLLGVGRVRSILRVPLAAAGFAFSYPGLYGTIGGGIACAILVALVWMDNKKAQTVGVPGE